MTDHLAREVARLRDEVESLRADHDAAARPRRSPATVIAVLALTIALAGGSAYAVATIGTSDIQNGAVTTPKLADGAVKAGKIAPGAVGPAKIADDAVRNRHLRDGAVTSAEIADGTITGTDLTPRLVRWAKVDADSTGAALLSSSAGVGSVAREFTGVYSVTFTESITGCGWLATINDNDAGSAPNGQIAVERGSFADSFTVWVRYFNASGSLADMANTDGFTLLVTC